MLTFLFLRKSKGGRKGRRVIFLTINAGAGGVAVTRDGGRRGDERKTENVEGLTFNVESERVKRLGLIVYGDKEGGGDIGGGYGDESVDDDGNTLLALVTCDTSRDACKTSLGDAYHLAFCEMSV